MLRKYGVSLSACKWFIFIFLEIIGVSSSHENNPLPQIANQTALSDFQWSAAGDWISFAEYRKIRIPFLRLFWFISAERLYLTKGRYFYGHPFRPVNHRFTNMILTTLKSIFNNLFRLDADNSRKEELCQVSKWIKMRRILSWTITMASIFL